MITIRYEKMGMIIWSDVEKKYFFTNDKNIIDKTRLLCRKIKDENVIDTKDDLNQELIRLGILSGVRELECSTEYLSAPLEYYFDFTSKCNLKCTHCYNKEHICNDTIPNNKIENIIKDMYDNGIMRIHLAGGEPTMVPEGLETYMKTAKKYGITSSMSSNGVVLTDEVMNIMFNNDLFSITVSLEGPDEESNSKIRGKENFDKAISNIKKLVDRKKALCSNTLVCLKMSYDTNISKGDLRKMIELALSLGVNVLKFSNPERCIFHSKGFYSSGYDNYYKVNNYVMELKEEYKNENIYISNIANPINNCGQIGLPNMRGCIGAQELIAINPDGRISPCLMNQINLGNIYDYDSIVDFWNNNDKIKEYRKTISNYDCNTCKSHKACRGGCQVRKYVEYGEIIGRDPLCSMKQNIKISDNKHKGDKFKNFSEIKVLHSL